MAWGLFSDEEKQHLEENEGLRLANIGEPVSLDSVQKFVLDDFWRRRSETNPEVAIAIEPDLDPILASHLRAMDVVYRKGRADSIKAEHDRAKAQAGSPPPPSQEIRRH